MTAIQKRADSQIFEQLIGEPHNAYNAFLSYRNIGASRTVVEAYRRFTGKDVGQAAGSWNKWSQVYHWEERAIAWDNNQRGDTLQIEEQVDKMNSRHVAIARAIQNKVAQRLQTLKPEELNPTQLITWFKVAAAIERTALTLPAPSVDVVEIENKVNNDDDTVGIKEEDEQSAIREAEQAFLDRIQGKSTSVGGDERLRDNSAGENPVLPVRVSSETPDGPVNKTNNPQSPTGWPQ